MCVVGVVLDISVWIMSRGREGLGTDEEMVPIPMQFSFLLNTSVFISASPSHPFLYLLSPFSESSKSPFLHKRLRRNALTPLDIPHSSNS